MIKIANVGEECGIAAVYLKKEAEYPAAYYLYKILLHQQRRGQLSAGITTFTPETEKDSECLKTHVEVGLVNEAFYENDENKFDELMNDLNGTIGIGHVRYSTSGAKKKTIRKLKKEGQPMYRDHGKTWKQFAIAFNGDITNYDELVKELREKHNYRPVTNVDTEVMKHFFSISIAKEQDKTNKHKPSLHNVIKEWYKKFDGAYSTVVLNGDGDLAIFRDPQAFKPLCYGENEHFLAAASESIALIKIGIDEKNIKSLKAGQVLIIENNDKELLQYANPSRLSHCMFEYIYFSRYESIIDNIPVSVVRENLGKKLAEKEPLKNKLDKDFIVVPIPDTSKPAAQAMAKKLGLPYVEAIQKTEFIGRIFINPQKTRKKKITDKFTFIVHMLNGKKVILFDDSIVRGDTSEEVIKNVKKAGAKEVHMRITCPEIEYPCFTGIDFHEPKEIIASDKTIEEIRQSIGADTLNYQAIDDLVEAIGLPKEELCLACLNGEYTTEGSRRLFDRAIK